MRGNSRKDPNPPHKGPQEPRRHIGNREIRRGSKLDGKMHLGTGGWGRGREGGEIKRESLRKLLGNNGGGALKKENQVRKLKRHSIRCMRVEF